MINPKQMFLQTTARHNSWPPQQTYYLGSILLVKKNKMKPTNPNAHTYVNGTDVKTHGYAVTHSTFLQ